ncbi:MAG: KpsF/GutQ family sugar-phosphate isomerase [Chlamydiota bacterium]
MLQELFDNTHQHLNYFFEHVDMKVMEEVFDILKSRPGMIILTGVGKSGLVAKKIAATMTSTNTRAIYLSPINALHGDLGIVTDRDVFVFLSKSGESEELLSLVPSLRNKGVKLIAVVSNKESRLAKASDRVVYLPLEKELCPFNMAPTTSTTIQMIFGDVITIGLMRLKNFSIEEYALNHPAGRIGKRITVKVRDLMIKGDNIPHCKPNDKLVDILVELSNKRCGCVLILDEGRKLKGIFTDGDLRRTLQNLGSDALNESMEKIMITTPRFISPDVLAREAIKIMENSLSHEVTVLPVVNDEKQVIGLIKLHDIIQTGI